MNDFVCVVCFRFVSCEGEFGHSRKKNKPIRVNCARDDRSRARGTVRSQNNKKKEHRNLMTAEGFEPSPLRMGA